MIDYQEIVNLCAQILKISLPIGLIFSLTEFAVAFFVKNVIGRWKNGL